MEILCEYIGFRYTIESKDGRFVAVPVPGQHSAANKERHRRAAMEWYLSGNGVVQQREEPPQEEHDHMEGLDDREF